jgi:hypothetical protein
MWGNAASAEKLLSQRRRGAKDGSAACDEAYSLKQTSLFYPQITQISADSWDFLRIYLVSR